MSQIVSVDDLVSLMTDAQIADLNTLMINRSGGGSVVPETRYLHKDWRAAGVAAPNSVANVLTSLWTFDGVPSGGVAPTTWVNPTNTTAGGLQQVDPTGGRKKFLSYLTGFVSTAGTVMFYDRLGHMGGMSGTTTTAQNTNAGSAGTITRYTTGERNWAWAEIYTALGATATTYTCSYVNQAGTAKTSTPMVIGGTSHTEINRIVPMSLASGDYGVRSVTSLTLAATTGTAGNFGVTIGRPLFFLPIGSTNTAVSRSYIDGSLPQILAGACIAMALLPSAANASIVDVWAEMIEA